MHTFSEVETYLSGLPAQARSYEERLKHVKFALEQLGNPQDAISAIHIAGTSGKGSTAYYSSSLLKASGYRVGLTVSPHVQSVAERAQVDGTLLAEDEYCGHFTEFAQKIQELEITLTYIEFLDIFAYWLFAKLKLDYIVVEVGLGGRLDPTNVITRPDKIAVITDIGFDHVEILGDTLAKIATEKAGIIGDSNTVVMHQQSDEVIDVIKATAKRHQATLTVLDSTSLDIAHHLPRFQRRNWQLAKAAVDLRLKRDGRDQLSERPVKKSLGISIPGRFEVFEKSDKTIILDSAHNPQKIAALVDSLEEAYRGGDITFIISFGENKRSTVKESIDILASRAAAIITTEFMLDQGESHAPISAPRLSDITKKRTGKSAIIEPNPLEALEVAEKSKNIIVVTGSFYLISNVREELMREFGRTK